MKIYVTKYLFTEGIQEMEAEKTQGGLVVRGVGPGFFNGVRSFNYNEWHMTREAAVAHAQTVRTKKLAALDKQRKKIEAMTFA